MAINEQARSPTRKTKARKPLYSKQHGSSFNLRQYVGEQTTRRKLLFFVCWLYIHHLTHYLENKNIHRIIFSKIAFFVLFCWN